MHLWLKILVPALLISIVGYVESISVALTLAAKKRQRVDPDQELIALGASNIGSAISGGFPVTGGFARSVVNFEAGAETPAAGAFTAVGIALGNIVPDPAPVLSPQGHSCGHNSSCRDVARQFQRVEAYLGILKSRLCRNACNNTGHTG